jgi:hypothetical protein
VRPFTFGQFNPWAHWISTGPIANTESDHEAHAAHYDLIGMGRPTRPWTADSTTTARRHGKLSPWAWAAGLSQAISNGTGT